MAYAAWVAADEVVTCVVDLSTHISASLIPIKHC